MSERAHIMNHDCSGTADHQSHRHKSDRQHNTFADQRPGKSDSPAGRSLKSLIIDKLKIIGQSPRKSAKQSPVIPESYPPNPPVKHRQTAEKPISTCGHINSTTFPMPARVNKIGNIMIAKGIIGDSDLQDALERKKQDPDKYLGQILSEMGFSQSRIMHEIYYSNKRKKLGEILVELNMVTREQLHQALIQQKYLKKEGAHVYLATLMIENRIICEKHYMKALSAHFSMPVVSLENFTVLQSLQKTIGERYALRNRIIVLSDMDNHITLAIAEPHLSIFDHLEKGIPKRKRISYKLARAAEIERCLNQIYHHDFYHDGVVAKQR